jgi:hypothetical protein
VVVQLTHLESVPEAAGRDQLPWNGCDLNH